MPLKRRALLGLISSATFLVSAGALGGRLPAAAPALRFPQGVASGDPQADSVMLWTRAEPTGPAAGPVPVRLQLSATPDFTAPLLDSLFSTDADSDFTLRVFVDELAADTLYYYRFEGGAGTVSTAGRTRTAPAKGQARDVRLAFASCQSYEQGFYGSWARMLADDERRPENERIDFVLHLGDFIYERTWPRLADGTPVPRPLPPFPDGARDGENTWAQSLADYRHLYKTYLSDPHLQAARARWPFVCTWDDHEFSNDNFGVHSTYGGRHLAERERKVAANRAWFEFIPAVLDELAEQPAHGFRPPRHPPTDDQARDSLRIYRRLQWGDNLDIVLTDSRSYRSPPCLPDGLAASLGLPLDTVKLVEIADAGREHSGGEPPRFLPYGEGDAENPGWKRPPGSLLGEQQRNWLLAQLRDSSARWKLWGNALPLLPMRLDLGALPFTDYEDSIFTLDAWAGYPHEQSLLLRQVEDAGVGGLVSFSGDHHMHGAGEVRHDPGDRNAAPVAVDFSVAGISSTPMFLELRKVSEESHPDFGALVFREEDGQITPTWNMTMLDGALSSLAYGRTGLRTAARWLGPNRANPGLRYVDVAANGYGLAHFSASELQVELLTVRGVREPFDAPPAIDYSARFRVSLWGAGEAPFIDGPAFEGDTPFPFQPRMG